MHLRCLLVHYERNDIIFSQSAVTQNVARNLYCKDCTVKGLHLIFLDFTIFKADGSNSLTS